MQQTDLPLRGLSRHQFGTLKFINDNKVTMGYLKIAHANTLGSLAWRGYLFITSNGAGDKAIVGLTPEGEKALRSYTSASINERQHEHELSERCLRLLRHSRRVVAMRKTA
jgi:hypothetical protein